MSHTEAGPALTSMTPDAPKRTARCAARERVRYLHVMEHKRPSRPTPLRLRLRRAHGRRSSSGSDREKSLKRKLKADALEKFQIAIA